MPDLPALAPELHKSEWEKKRGVLAKLAGKIVGDGTNLSKLLALAETNWKDTAKAVKTSPADTKISCATFTIVLKDVVSECDKILKALDKPLIKNTTKESQNYLKSIKAEANTLLPLLASPATLT